MKTYINFKLKEGQRKKDVCEKIAMHLWKYFKKRDCDGKLGTENTVSNDDLRKIVAKYINRKRWIRNSDKENLDRYMLFIERQTRQAINKLITPSNEFFFPGLLNNPYQGYFLVNTKKELEYIRREKQNHIDGYIHNLENRTIEAGKRIDLRLTGRKIDDDSKLLDKKDDDSKGPEIQ